MTDQIKNRYVDFAVEDHFEYYIVSALNVEEDEVFEMKIDFWEVIHFLVAEVGMKRLKAVNDFPALYAACEERELLEEIFIHKMTSNV